MPPSLLFHVRSVPLAESVDTWTWSRGRWRLTCCESVSGVCWDPLQLVGVVDILLRVHEPSRLTIYVDEPYALKCLLGKATPIFREARELLTDIRRFEHLHISVTYSRLPRTVAA